MTGCFENQTGNHFVLIVSITIFQLVLLTISTFLALIGVIWFITFRIEDSNLYTRLGSYKDFSGGVFRLTVRVVDDLDPALFDEQTVLVSFTLNLTSGL